MTEKLQHLTHTHCIEKNSINKEKSTERFGFCDGFLLTVPFTVIILTILYIQLLTSFQNTLGKKSNEIDCGLECMQDFNN